MILKSNFTICDVINFRLELIWHRYHNFLIFLIFNFFKFLPMREGKQKTNELFSGAVEGARPSRVFKAGRHWRSGGNWVEKGLSVKGEDIKDSRAIHVPGP